MQNPLDSLLITGTTSFIGGSTAGLLTAGVLVLNGDLLAAGQSATAFAPSGTHKTVLTASAAQLSFGTPGSGAAGSHFQTLDISQVFGGVSLFTSVFVDGTLIASDPGNTLIGNGTGTSLTARQWQVSALNVENATMVLDEQGTAATEQFSNVSFSGFPTTGSTQIRVLAPGAATPRALSFSNLIFQPMPVGAGDFYVDITATVSGSLALTLPGSNQGTAANGNGPTLTKTTGNVSVSWP
jgi:hypothetical protein